jgi:hypothetical protein
MHDLELMTSENRELKMATGVKIDLWKYRIKKSAIGPYKVGIPGLMD